MLVGSVALAQRIEQAETRLSLSTVDGARRDGVRGAFGLQVGGGAAVYCGEESPMTKVIGLGLTAPLTDADLDAFEEAYARTGTRPGVEMATFADLTAIRLLEGRGYRLQRVELVLGCALDHPGRDDVLPEGTRPDGVTVAEGPDAVWADVVVEGFAAAETVAGRDAPAEAYDRAVIAQVVRQFGGMSGVRRYVASVRGVPVGAASARVDGRLYQFCGAATLPAWRRQGVQTALLQWRLQDARAAGCDLAVVTVEPGSRSQANVQRRGFVPLYSRLVLAPGT
jgi:GNAT superfamily N-acetyltransferase